MNKNFQKKTAYDYVQQTKKENFIFLNEKYAQQGQTVLFGDSITEIFNSYELFYAFSQTTEQAVYNRGISGDTSDRLLERLECNALNISPKNLVILIGTNDIGIGLPTEYTLNNIKEILQRTQKLCSNTNIVLQAIYPVNSHLSIIARQMVSKRSNKKILAVNEELHKIALENKVQWLDLTKVLSDEKGRLAKEYSFDGLHLNAQGFEIVSENIIPLLK